MKIPPDDKLRHVGGNEVAQQDIVSEEAPAGTITQEALHFNPENGLVWPIEGTVLLDYSMESTIFFPTLQQYQYNPAMVLSGKVNDKVYFIAKGKIKGVFRLKDLIDNNVSLEELYLAIQENPNIELDDNIKKLSIYKEDVE